AATILDEVAPVLDDVAFKQAGGPVMQIAMIARLAGISFESANQKLLQSLDMKLLETDIAEASRAVSLGSPKIPEGLIESLADTNNIDQWIAEAARRLGNPPSRIEWIL